MKGGTGTMRGASLMEHNGAAASNGYIGNQHLSKMMSSLTGGSKKKPNTKTKTNRRNKKGCNKKGGMGFGGVIREALVPFGLYALQKRTQRRRSGSKKHMKRSRKTSKRSRR